MKIKKLIIGKNSSIVKGMFKNLKNFDYISHQDINKTDLQPYKWIFLFSWSKTSINDNKKIIKKIPKKKLVFISTVAMYSLNLRDQWNKYVVNKNEIEKIVEQNKSYIVRLGIFNNNKHFGVIPYTSLVSVVNLLNNWSGNEDQVIDLYSIVTTKKEKNLLVETLNKISRVFFNVYSIRIIIESIIKYIFKSANYGYTADTLCFFHKKIQVGYGAIGCEYYKKNNFKHLVIASDAEDYKINKGGFINTILGFKYTGLSKYWHGAYLTTKNNIIKKHVPLFVRRNKIPSNNVIGHVEQIEYINNFFKIKVSNQKRSAYYFCEKLVLSSGSIENVKLLRQITQKKLNNYFFSDQEWFSFGEIALDEALDMGYIKKFGPFIYRGKLLHIPNQKNYSSLIEFRPLSYSKHINNDLLFYSDTTKNILIKIYTQFSFSRLNEAFFNKFGFSFLTHNIVAVGQVDAKNCITLKEDLRLERKRIVGREFLKIRNKLSSNFETFIKYNHFNSADSQHISSDLQILKDKFVENLLRKKVLIYLGLRHDLEVNKFYPTNYSLDKNLIKE
ncbi:hypothetical protein OAH48_01315 [Methylophilaceae bacterium]|nr:hypothetical protein [Methylophilaceae bacterium]|tara:strand:+ start:1992 stop:3665 length:1674 start_codon:yes stop_codon:yes gene_type:complete